jgi:single-stranded-DNA-specific exonuclease
LVAAIAADIVPMTGENRVLAYFGLQVINSDPRPGIKALVHQVKKQTLDITDVVLSSHKINAAGRSNMAIMPYCWNLILNKHSNLLQK